MSKKSYLAKNIGLLTVSSFATKLLTFFLVPLYTNILSTAEYGSYDLINSTIGLMMPILTLNIFEAVLRFSMDDENDPSQIFSIGVKYIGISTIIVAIFIMLNSFLNIFPVIKDYWYFFFIMYFLNVAFELVARMARGLGLVADLAVSGVLCSIVTISCNILFLLVIKLGLIGYFLATIIGLFVNFIYLFIRMRGWNYISTRNIDKQLQTEMTDYSKPLIANSISWWINNLSDRYIVTWLCGVSINGIYSMGYKIPSILNVFQGIFSQAWSLSAVKDFDAEDSDGFFSNMYNLYNFGMVIVCSGLILFNKLLARILFAKDFYEAWIFVPFLLISVVFGALAGYIGGIFSAVKDSKIYAKSTMAGAIINIILNLILVYYMGALGAAIATLVSYWVVWLIRIKVLKKYIHMQIHYVRDYISYGLLIFQAVFLILYDKSIILLYTVEGIVVISILCLYMKEMLSIIKLLKRKAGF